MELFKQKQPYKPLDRVIIFAHDESSKFFADILHIESIENGRIITDNAELVLPLEDAKTFTTNEGILYAFNMSLEYLKEVQHLGIVEKNIIIEQAFMYPGKNREAEKSNLMNMVIIGALSLITIISLFT
jgi:hypothetical protein